MSASLRQLQQQLRDKSLGVRELVQHSLDRIERLNPQLNALISVQAEQALDAASTQQRVIDAGTGGPLTGLPLVHKDLFCTQGVTTTCASRMLSNFVPPYDATAVQRLSAAGMITLGKANMDEFAMGSSNENSAYGAVSNPWDPARVPGGSSGGSAAAVAAGLVPAASATDTGGSIRQPAALCGVTGVKPSYGRVSRHGMVAFASSLDQGGVMARSAEDCALVLSAMCGHDPLDSTSTAAAELPFSAQPVHATKGLRVGLVRDWFEQLDAPMAASLQQAIAALADLGVQFEDVELPHADLAVAAYYILAPAECSSNLSRFDGVRFGHQCDGATDLQDLYVRSRSEGFGAEVQRRILVGTWALSAGYYDAYYVKAQKIRRLIADDFSRAFDRVDVLLGPVTPETAFRKGAKADSVSMYQADVFTIPASLAGLPCLSLPCAPVAGLPVGLQLMGRYMDDARILDLARHLQAHTDWHLAQPEGLA